MEGKKKKARRPNGHAAPAGLNVLESFEAGQEILGGISTDGGLSGYTVRLRPYSCQGTGLCWKLELWVGVNSTFVDRDNLLADHECKEDYLRLLIQGEASGFRRVKGGAALMAWMTRKGLMMIATHKPEIKRRVRAEQRAQRKLSEA